MEGEEEIGVRLKCRENEYMPYIMNEEESEGRNTWNDDVYVFATPHPHQ